MNNMNINSTWTTSIVVIDFYTTSKTICIATTLNILKVLIQCRLPIPQFSSSHCILVTILTQPSEIQEWNYIFDFQQIKHTSQNPKLCFIKKWKKLEFHSLTCSGSPKAKQVECFKFSNHNLIPLPHSKL